MMALDGRTMHAIAASTSATRIRLTRQLRRKTSADPRTPSHGQYDNARAVNAVSSELLNVRAVMKALASDSTEQTSWSR